MVGRLRKPHLTPKVGLSRRVIVQFIVRDCDVYRLKRRHYLTLATV